MPLASYRAVSDSHLNCQRAAVCHPAARLTDYHSTNYVTEAYPWFPIGRHHRPVSCRFAFAFGLILRDSRPMLLSIHPRPVAILTRLSSGTHLFVNATYTLL